MADPRGLTRKDLESLSHQFNQEGVKTSTEELDGTTTSDELVFSDVASKISYQVSGTLVCDVAVSITGVDFVTISSGINTASGIISYSTHNTIKVKVTRVSGTGRVSIAGI